MILSEHLTNLIMYYVDTSGIVFFLHDSAGNFVESYPKINQTQHNYYANTDFYSVLINQSIKSNYPHVYSGNAADNWSCVPIWTQDRQNMYLIVGPVYTSPISERTIMELHNEGVISDQGRELLLKYREQLPVMHYSEYLKIIRQLHYVISGELLDLNKFGLAIHPEIKKTAEKVVIAQKQLLLDDNIVHDTYNFERRMMSLIQEGNIPALERLLQSGPTGSEGLLSRDNPIRQSKNLAIVSVTLVTRAAIEGGLNPDLALTLSDLFIQQIEEINDASKIITLQQELIFEFTKRVSDLKQRSTSKFVQDCTNYIQKNIYSDIQAEDIAEHIGMSTNYTSQKFKQELGESINNYVKRAKIDEARALLQYSDLSLTEISERLGFSSQSFFTSVFKKQTGMTPRQFREQEDLS
ncbi:MAG: hypothetical protein PWP10_3872 [Clostridiales bacterium]|jgi:YSIRK-targeted surface antigen transcriptional regulator|nr:hypothetical protein [Clostridiales bacterium]